MISYLKSTNLSSLKELLKKNNNKRILVISGKKSYYKSGANKIFFNLFKKFKHLNFYFKQSYFPEISELIKIIRRIKIFQPDIIISIGGGSVIDYAKIANTLYDCRNIKNLIIKSKYNIKNKYVVCTIGNDNLLQCVYSFGEDVFAIQFIACGCVFRKNARCITIRF